MPFDTVGTPYNKVAVTPGFPALAPITTHRVGSGGSGVMAQVGGATGTGSSTIALTGAVFAGQIIAINLAIPNPNTVGQPAGVSTAVLPNASVQVSTTYTSSATDTLTTIATALKNAMNANPLLAPLILATNAVGVITIAALAVGVTYPLSVSTTPAPASDTITVTGTFGAGRALSVTITGLNGLAPVVVNYVTVAGDTTATILGNNIATAINASLAVSGGTQSQFLQAATNAVGVITLLSTLTNAAANTIALAAVSAGGTTLTVGAATFANGGSALGVAASAPALDLPNTVDPTATFANAQPGGSGAAMFYQGMPTDVDTATKTDLRAQALV